MDAASLTALVAELLAAIHLMTGSPVPAEPPAVHFIPQSRLAGMVCQRPCRIRAVYFRDGAVYLDETLDVLGEDLDRSILLHELVHHVQAVTGRYDAMPADCRRWTAAEREAYALQRRYLRRINSPTMVVQPPESRNC